MAATDPNTTNTITLWLPFLPAAISAAFAGLTFLFSMYVWRKTRQLSIPTERPIIAIKETVCEIVPLSSQEAPQRYKISLQLGFQNVGKHPADDVKATMWASPVNDPSQLQKIGESTIANTIYPDDQFARVIRGTLRCKKPLSSGTPLRDTLFIFINALYLDGFNWKASFSSNVYLVYTIGEPRAGHAGIQEKERFDPHLRKLTSPPGANISSQPEL